jgi:hypothetical protein
MPKVFEVSGQPISLSRRSFIYLNFLLVSSIIKAKCRELFP